MEHAAPADGILTNARILTNRPSMPWATELVWHRGRIIHVGGPGSSKGAAGSGTRTFDLEGRLVLPGLCDSHIHFTNWSLSLREVDLFEVPTLADMVDRLRNATADLEEDHWLLGRGWNQAIWPEGRFPSRHDLDSACGHRPVLLYAKSGHAAVASTAALRRAGFLDAARHLARWARKLGFSVPPREVELPALPGFTQDDLAGLGIRCRQTPEGLAVIRRAR
jgi:hypothetical protein